MVDDFPRHILRGHTQRVSASGALCCTEAPRRGNRLTLLTAFRFMNLMATASSVSVSLASTTKPKAPALRSLMRRYLLLPCVRRQRWCGTHLLNRAIMSSTNVQMPPCYFLPVPLCVTHRQRVRVCASSLAHQGADSAQVRCRTLPGAVCYASGWVSSLTLARRPVRVGEEHSQLYSCAKLRFSAPRSCARQLPPKQA